MHNRIYRSSTSAPAPRCLRLSPALSAALACLALMGSAFAAPGAYKTEWGAHGVQVIDNHVLPSNPGQRSLRARIAYPDGAGPFPLVVYSHGFNCYREAIPGLPITGRRTATWWCCPSTPIAQPLKPE